MAYQTINPTTNELIKTYPDHTDQQIEEALAAAHTLYKSEWPKGSIQPRLAVLRKPELPFGGVKHSGYGRELSELGIKEFVNQKLVLVKQ